MFKIQNYPSPFLSSSALFIPSFSSSVFLSLPSISHRLWAVRRALKATHYAAHTHTHTDTNTHPRTVKHSAIWLCWDLTLGSSCHCRIWNESNLNFSAPKDSHNWVLNVNTAFQTPAACLWVFLPSGHSTYSKSHVKLPVLRLFFFLKVHYGRFFGVKNEQKSIIEQVNNHKGKLMKWDLCKKSFHVSHYWHSLQLKDWL